MFTIQYEAISGEHRMQSLESTSRFTLMKHLCRFKRPIVAVYEQASPITKAMRAELRKRPLNTLSIYARKFAASQVPGETLANSSSISNGA